MVEFGFFLFLNFLDQIKKSKMLNCLEKKRSIDLGRFGTHARTIYFSKMHLKNRIPTILLTSPLTEVVPIYTLSQAIKR